MSVASTTTDDTVRLVDQLELPSRIGPDETVIHTLTEGGRVREEHWRSESYLGSGGVGLVFREKCVVGRGYGRLRAVKEIPRPTRAVGAGRNANGNGGNEDVDIGGELAGLATFSRARYEAHFVRMLGWYQSPSKTFVAMEYLPLGDLHAHLMEEGPMQEDMAKLVIRQVIRGLAYIHEYGLAHRGLKPSVRSQQ